MDGNGQPPYNVSVKHDCAVENADRQKGFGDVLVILADLRADLLGAGGDLLLGVQHAFDVIFLTLQSNQPFPKKFFVMVSLP